VWLCVWECRDLGFYHKAGSDVKLKMKNEK